MRNKVILPVIEVKQPIGSFYAGVMSFSDLIEISSSDMRRIESGKDQFVGIQRKLRQDRVQEIGNFVQSIDATFPTSVVLSVPGVCSAYDESSGRLTLKEYVNEMGELEVPFRKIANILDGQHRIEGLKALGSGDVFDIPVSIFIDPDASDEAYIFATVNLAQTKVNRSLVYDLLDFAKARSPQKSCHDVAVALDKFETSPLRGMIKRLGTATPGRSGETLAQATVVVSLLALMTTNADEDRYALAKGKAPARTTNYQRTPLRPLWLDENDSHIARVLINYFAAVEDKWPKAWATRERGHILPRTNGFRALMRFLHNAYLHLRPQESSSRNVVTRDEFASLFQDMPDDPDRFHVDFYAPGTSGETALYKDFRRWAGI